MANHVRQRPRFHSLQIHGDQIRQRALRDHAQFSLHSQRLRRVRRRHAQHRRRRARARVHGRHLPHQRGIAHLAEHVEVVVGARGIRAQTHVHAAIQHLLDRADARGELEIGGGVVHHRRLVGSQQFDVVVRNVHAVRADRVGEQIVRCKVL